MGDESKKTEEQAILRDALILRGRVGSPDRGSVTWHNLSPTFLLDAVSLIERLAVAVNGMAEGPEGIPEAPKEDVGPGLRLAITLLADHLREVQEKARKYPEGCEARGKMDAMVSAVQTCVEDMCATLREAGGKGHGWDEKTPGLRLAIAVLEGEQALAAEAFNRHVSENRSAAFQQGAHDAISRCLEMLRDQIVNGEGKKTPPQGGSPAPQPVYVALFKGDSFSSIRRFGSVDTARAFIDGWGEAADDLKNDFSGYVLPDDEEEMNHYQPSAQCWAAERAVGSAMQEDSVAEQKDGR